TFMEILTGSLIASLCFSSTGPDAFKRLSRSTADDHDEMEHYCSLREHLTSLKEECSELKEDFVTLKELVRRLQVQQSEAELRSASLERDNRREDDAAKALWNQIDDMEAKIAELEADADTLRNEKSHLVAQGLKNEKKIQTQREDIENKFKDIARLEKILESALKEKAELQGQMQTMQAGHKRLKEELKEKEQVAESVNAGVLLQTAEEEIKSRNSSIFTLRQQ
ncbi:hypothetical protein C8R45DRAFT_948601, partial [Mycena sanguinolenta]